MKKIFLLPAILTTAALTSCLDNDNGTTSDVAPGMAIYNTAKSQANTDTDPLIIALKLNTLLETADSLGVDYTVAEVVIQEADEDEETEEETALAMELIFGENTVSNSGTRYTVQFTSAEAMDKEQAYRIGSVTIETNGYTLSDLDESGSMWEIVQDGGYDLYYPSSFTDKIVNLFDYYYIEPSGLGAGSWNISGHSRSYFSSLPSGAADSELSYTLVNEGGGRFFYTDILSAAFYLSGTSQGKFLYSDFNTTYEAKNLKFKPACYLYIAYGGSETATIERSALSIEEYPSNTVKYNWYDGTASTACGNTMEVTYNGITVSY